MAYPTSSRPTDLEVANQSFPAFRSDLNKILEHTTQFHAGTSRPSYINHGMMWLDITDSANPILKFYDGSDDITFATFNTSANTVNVSDSAFDIVTDTSPQLGGNLDVNGNSIVSTSNADINITPNGTGRIVFGTACLPKTNASSGLTLNFDTHQNFFVTLSSGSNTLATPTTEDSNIGQSGIIVFIQPASGTGTVTLSTDYETVGAGGVNSLGLSGTVDQYDIVPYFIKATNSILLGSPQLNFG
jgi:hypothetical protein